ncbi:hypothetical protein RJ55_04068 [Drechmeria coniospora]|nr:hypothetical protein RJ55_04068 [Drechmeria coniospora]
MPDWRASWKGERQPDDGLAFSPSQLQILRIMSLVMASFSIISTMLATFWFFRARRTLRRECVPPPHPPSHVSSVLIAICIAAPLPLPCSFSLILLLIQSDLLKATSCVVFPAVELSRGTVTPASPICQLSGFFLTLGIEACDMAVALVALHTALFVFCGRNGLFPYRRIAYATFVFLPLLLTSLAFVNKPAFAKAGPFCYLPAMPRWPRRVLSWGPRYAILVTVCAAYLSTYIYVKLLMRRYREQGAAMPGRLPIVDGQAGPRDPLFPPTAVPLVCHGLVATSAEEVSEQSPSRAAAPSAGRTERQVPSAAPEGCVEWDVPKAGFDLAGSVANHRDDGSNSHSCPSHAHTSDSHPRPSTLPISRVGGHSFSCQSPETQAQAEAKSCRCCCSVAVTARVMATRPSTPPRHVISPNHQPHGTQVPTIPFLSPIATDIAKTRKQVHRRLRQLFVYPILYAVVWLMPLVAHLVDGDGTEPSFGLVLASLASLCSQGVADVLVLSTVEKPWRQPRRDSWSPLFRSPFFRRFTLSPASITRANVGRTREEMLVDGMTARRR